MSPMRMGVCGWSPGSIPRMVEADHDSFVDGRQRWLDHSLHGSGELGRTRSSNASPCATSLVLQSRTSRTELGRGTLLPW